MRRNAAVAIRCCVFETGTFFCSMKVLIQSEKTVCRENVIRRVQCEAPSSPPFFTVFTGGRRQRKDVFRTLS